MFLRLGAAAYLTLASFLWLSLISAEDPLIKALGGLGMAQVIGYAAFFWAIFFALPHVWAWRPDSLGQGVALFNRLGRGAWGLAGAGLALVGLALTASAIFALKPFGVNTALVALLTGSALLGGGSAQLWSAWQAALQQGAPEQQQQAAHIKRIAELARHQRGRLTVGEVAAELGLPRPQVDVLMRRMSEEGWCEQRVNTAGAGFYYFPDFADPDSKRDIFEDDDGVVFDAEVNQQAQQEAKHGRSQRRRS
jgi:hypothetical protein